jgi:hypothetical protein
MDDHRQDHPDQKDKRQPSPEERCIAGSKVLLVRNYLTREHPPPKPERCLIQRVISTETLPTGNGPINGEQSNGEPTSSLLQSNDEPTINGGPTINGPINGKRRTSLNAKLGLTLTAAVAAVGLWWYSTSNNGNA